MNYKRLKKFIHSSELQGDAFASELFSLLRAEVKRSEALFLELLAELERGVEYLLSLSPDQLIEPPQQKGPFYSRRVHHSRSLSKEAGNPNVSNSGYDTMEASRGAEVNEEGGKRVSASPATVVGLLPETGRLLPRSEWSGSFSLRRSSYITELDYSDDEVGCIHRCTRWVKKIFLRIIGDFHLKVIASNTPEAAYLEWNSNAHKLKHFAELNVEAVRKTLKKMKKHRSCRPEFDSEIEYLIENSLLRRNLPLLQRLIDAVHADFERKFEDPLERFSSMSLAEHWQVHWRYVLLAVLSFVFILRIPFWQENQSAHHCVALFALVIILWLTEAIPFFCTAMLIPLVAVPLEIIADPRSGHAATHSQASQILLGKMFNHVQILVMGGLTIGKAVARTHLEMYAVSALHRFTAHRPRLYMLVLMLASCILCAFVSNVAAPLLALSVMRHTLWGFRDDTTAPQGLLLGLAFACNLGGMLSPIASPQNAVAMTVLHFHSISFSRWFMVALPVVLLSVVAAWATILVLWKPFENVLYIPLQVTDIVREKKVSPVDRVVVLVVSAVTITLWMWPSNFIFGDTGIVALIPIVVFFGMGILSKEDFNTLSWHLMFLLAGGNMLGLCARDSRVLEILSSQLEEALDHTTPYLAVVGVTVTVAIITTFVSHTVAAMILLPMIAEIGFLMPPSPGHGWESWFSPSPQSLVMIAALMCSGAMTFPISSFPNVNSLLVEDSSGNPYLRAKDFLLSGSIVSFFFFVCLISWMVPYTNYLLQ